MESYSYYSYLLAFLAFAALTPLVFFGFRKNVLSAPLLTAITGTLIWSGYIVHNLRNDTFFTSDSLPFETLRYAAWYFLLAAIIVKNKLNESYASLLKSKYSYFIVLLTALIFLLELNPDYLSPLNHYLTTELRLFAHVLFAIIGLVLIEQIYRNTFSEQRWAIKYFCLGLGSLFMIDFMLYSKSLLFKSLDISLWNSRGFINALVTPMLALSILRLRSNSTVLAVSRKLVFHTTLLFGLGVYLILMSVAGVYIRDYGGSWGELAQITFIFLAIVLLLILFFSGKIRARAKVYFSKHFFQYSYDYREEWIKLSKTLAKLDSVGKLAGLVVKTLEKLVQSNGGGLWLKNEQGDFYLTEQHNLGFEPEFLFKKDTPFIRFLDAKQWVIDFMEYHKDPELYNDIDLSDWHSGSDHIWLIVPLLRLNSLEAFVVLTRARAPRVLNWEDHDLLKTVGMQFANALALNQTIDELSRTRQFEAYSRLSAFVVHDLKNLVAQIALIVKNAEKHKNNPEFIDDSIATLENVTHKILHIIDQLKSSHKTENKTVIDLVNIVKDVALQQAGNQPVLQVSTSLDACPVCGEQAKMTAILGHLVQNAQDATPQNGFVKLDLSKHEDQAIIKISDNGSGMDKKFIAERLFKPFDSTKGNAGMGIGVYEARDYILKSSGQIAVESTPGQGTVFTIMLPLFELPID
ncbi:MAG: PEP-CTERM system histidine kinase PrsK [Gammaproteobacteria bacterium HGW-Gammaproteobacteria-3]|nr:MAG: PEP-CTERM system histidine kinase PrsK [Gammaproteobacteria bacterium HGW-Gammaproteobacteria-3]